MKAIEASSLRQLSDTKFVVEKITQLPHGDCSQVFSLGQFSYTKYVVEKITQLPHGDCSQVFFIGPVFLYKICCGKDHTTATW